jgi:hypothetical protein
MAQLSVWWGAGVLTAGVGAAVLTSAGAAHADTETGADPGGTRTSANEAASEPDTSSEHERDAAAEPSDPEKAEDSDPPGTRRNDKPAHRQSPYRSHGGEPETARETGAQDTDPEPEGSSTREPASEEASTRDPEPDTPDTITGRTTAPAALAAPAESEDADESSASIPVVGDVLGPFQPDYPPLVRAVGSAIFNFLGAVIQAADGPPLVPADLRDSVQVSSSSLVVSPGNELAADWYFPTGGGQPQRLIYLQHGILATGPMYSYTASYLAQRTNSVVVVTTITSNPFADDGMWLGGDNMHKAVAQLFLDDNRRALNASLTTATLKAGVSSLTVPDEFVLVGHSLGGGFGPGVAGHYAEGLVARRADGQNDGDTTNHLAGVVTLDAVPISPILPNAMDRMKALEDSNGGDHADYIPVYEIGAPFNFLNAFSAVKTELSDARPGKFNGVVINGGVHMDGMLGGNPLIQAAAYLVAGIPQPQNPPAVQLLMAGWINDMFSDVIDPTTGRCLGADCAGQYGNPGDTLYLPTDSGEASAVVIDSGSLPSIQMLPGGRFQPLEASSVVLPQVRRPAIALRVAG